MGLDLDDFYSISKAYSQKEESRFRESYERARFAAALVVGPFSGNVSPKRLCTFPWEKDDHEQERPKESKEEHRKRMADALEKWGSTY